MAQRGQRAALQAKRTSGGFLAAVGLRTCGGQDGGTADGDLEVAAPVIS